MMVQGFGWLRFRFVFRSGLFRCLGLFQVVYDGLGLFRVQVCFGLCVFSLTVLGGRSAF